MLLRVKNLGPVREAELDLGKPLIVLTGPNNSGKTYLAWAAYSFARLDRSRVLAPQGLRGWAERLLASPQRSLALETLFECRGVALQAMAETVANQLARDFAAPPDRFEETSFQLESTAEEEAAFLALDGRIVTQYTGNKEISFDIREGRLHLLERAREIQGEDAKPWEPGATVDDVAQLATMVLLGKFSERRYVAFPVERMAINLFARELAASSRELVDDLLNDETSDASPSARLAKLSKSATRYPRAIHDAIQRAIRGPTVAETSRYVDLAAELETRVLDGRVSLDLDEPRFVSNRDPRERRLGLYESASVVKSLVSLVLYLRHDAAPRQRLVIDEPELNLHPDNQRGITRILAKAVNRGLKIMMSTHSDYVIRELNNLVMLSQESDEAREVMNELGYHQDEVLSRDTIEAYMVNDGVCKRLEMTKTGFESETIEVEIDKLNQDAQTIYLRLFCG
ncbi:AAA family ATPase [Paraliomyxa miuraensis]|uniref:AAA family ATPase n=1 Tax=Paraliomyxa miuraensis TaxID=376150 RepID=UPI00225A2FF0|nr:AAA family ATPase [Paraliomyxa miuraensis]MCX4248043.1 AAA family ATPase [Paraliomyxa miuraensis]